MSFDHERWVRFEFEQTPVYVRKDRPDWFVPNRNGDMQLQELAKGHKPGDLSARRFFNRLPDSPALNYEGRFDHLSLDGLKEVWFHITNRCNLACNHCMFLSAPDEKQQLGKEDIFRYADQAATAGCRIFSLTGGEPFVHKEFEAIVDHLLGYEDSHVVVLTTTGCCYPSTLRQSGVGPSIGSICRSALTEIASSTIEFAVTGPLQSSNMSFLGCNR